MTTVGVMILLALVCLGIQDAYANHSYRLASCSPEEDVIRNLPPNCKIAMKLDFGDEKTGSECTYKIDCDDRMSMETKSSLSHSEDLGTNSHLHLVDDPVVSGIVPRGITTGPESDFLDKARARTATLKNLLMSYNDPSFPKQWNIISDGSVPNTALGYDDNVAPLMVNNITGSGINVVLLDDGMKIDHPDLAANVDKNLVLDLTGSGKIDGEHGTACGSLVAAVGGNRNCIVGAAPTAKLGIVKVVGSIITETQEAKALNAFSDKAHVYSNSWGPCDKGVTIAGPGSLSISATQLGVTKGRNGLGSIYTWAAGNGGDVGDSCGADMYVNNPFVLPVQAVAEDGRVPSYGETCAAILASTYIGNQNSPCDLINGQCLNAFPGTSAATPIMSACAASILQVNSRLTWRDVEHIIAYSAALPRGKDLSWQVTAGGLLRSDTIGFGMVDCNRASRFAKSWTNAGVMCVAFGTEGYANANWPTSYNQVLRLTTQSMLDSLIRNAPSWSTPIFYGKTRVMSFRFDQTATIRGKAVFVSQQGTPQAEGSACTIDRVEKITVSIQMAHICRGSLTIWMLSPSGTYSILLGPRPKDDFYGKFTLSMTSRTFLGEKMNGVWQLLFSDKGDCSDNPLVNRLKFNAQLSGYTNYVKLQIFGSSEDGCPYNKNKAIIDPVMTSVAEAARNTSTSHIITDQELSQVQLEDKWSRVVEPNATL